MPFGATRRGFESHPLRHTSHVDELTSGTRLRLEYGDHNDAFAAELPRDVDVLRPVTARNGVDDWCLVGLAEPVRAEGIAYTRLLLRSRELGTPLGGPASTSVFILLVGDGDGPDDGFDPHDFLHVAWGVASRLASAD
jgi:hypothetical protein